MKERERASEDKVKPFVLDDSDEDDRVAGRDGGSRLKNADLKETTITAIERPSELRSDIHSGDNTELGPDEIPKVELLVSRVGPVDGTTLHRMLMVYSDGEDESDMMDSANESC